MICDSRRNDHFYVIILFFIDKHIELIMVWFLQGCVLNKDASLGL